MATNRMQDHTPQFGSDAGQPSHGHVPAVPPGFAVCPPHLVAAHAWQQAIYQAAYEQAKAATQAPRFHRLLFSNWN